MIESIKEIFHCHPYSSSEKGSIKNAHRLLRRYIPKGKSIDKYVGQDLKPIADL
ncbi:Transposase,IS30 family protein [Mycoplasmopsis bovis CQ-W70]|uniref:Transposase,IS30 family protein n=1 Tax=Mycoplasmopsis bovis CQ-W70 TaxID=1316930 RepID=A0A059Y7J8_MYCBV|nr:Transposase,IS30 family protein [Mycoplasmopsis bovis CQ-W70]